MNPYLLGLMTKLMMAALALFGQTEFIHNGVEVDDFKVCYECLTPANDQVPEIACFRKGEAVPEMSCTRLVGVRVYTASNWEAKGIPTIFADGVVDLRDAVFALKTTAGEK